MSATTNYLDRRFYATFGATWDAKLFRERVARRLSPTSSVLDFGAGRGAHVEMDWRSHSSFVAGVDVDDAVLANPRVHESRLLAPDGTIPYSDREFDVVVAHNVLEHLPNPVASFREICRVLKPGGVFLSKTPNRWHYVTTIAALTPHAFHVWVNDRRGRPTVDTFPTLYRANSTRAMMRLADRAGFAVESIELIEGRPEYLRHNVALYCGGILYERLVNSSSLLEPFRLVMFSTLRKRD